MRCLHCDREISETFLEDQAKAGDGRFQCPHCRAEHVRREIDPLPTGKRQFTFRLWGHLSAIRKKDAGTKRRKGRVTPERSSEGPARDSTPPEADPPRGA